MSRSGKNGHMLCVRLFCALALLFVGFAHRPMAYAAPSSAELSAYALPDGSLPDLCLPGMDGKGKNQGAEPCYACILVSGMALPLPAPAIGQPLAATSTIVFVWRPEAFQHHLFPPNAAPRAPPVLSLAA